MPVPKKRVGHSDQGHRRANWKARPITKTSCPHCGNLNFTHTLCTSCGYYNGRIVSTKMHAHHAH
jgi:large subunit ribosomal protein L32